MKDNTCVQHRGIHRYFIVIIAKTIMCTIYNRNPIKDYNLYLNIVYINLEANEGTNSCLNQIFIKAHHSVHAYNMASSTIRITCDEAKMCVYITLMVQVYAFSRLLLLSRN